MPATHNTTTRNWQPPTEQWGLPCYLHQLSLSIDLPHPLQWCHTNLTGSTLLNQKGDTDFTSTVVLSPEFLYINSSWVPWIDFKIALIIDYPSLLFPKYLPKRPRTDRTITKIFEQLELERVPCEWYHLSSAKIEKESIKLLVVREPTSLTTFLKSALFKLPVEGWPSNHDTKNIQCFKLDQVGQGSSFEIKLVRYSSLSRLKISHTYLVMRQPRELGQFEFGNPTQTWSSG